MDLQDSCFNTSGAGIRGLDHHVCLLLYKLKTEAQDGWVIQDIVEGRYGGMLVILARGRWRQKNQESKPNLAPWYPSCFKNVCVCV